MQILKSLGDGIGTAAGVAWPTFGIIFGTLGLNTGATTAIALSSISIGLFLLVFLPITYWSYKSYLKENKKLRQALQEQRDQVYEHMLHYLISILRKCLLNNQITHISDIDQNALIQQIESEIGEDIKTNNYMPQIEEYLDYLRNNSVLPALITILTNSKNNIADNKLTIKSEHKEELFGNIKKIFKNCNHFTPKITDFSEQIKMGIIGFSAAFGSIAGCSAGTIGLLTAVGVFAGLATVPILGWAILGVATIFGLAVAAACVHSAHVKSKKIQLVKYYEQINTELSSSVKWNNNSTAAKIEAKKELTESFRHYLKANVPHNPTGTADLIEPYSSVQHPLWSSASSSSANPAPKQRPPQQRRKSACN